MADTKISGKQLLIQIGINVVASAIVSYIMYKVLQPKDEESTLAVRATQSKPVITQSAADNQVTTQ